MKITNEIKAKIFAQYLGQKVKLVGGQIVELSAFYSGTLYCGIKEAITDVDVYSPKLILKPLSSITDEDAIECSKLHNIEFVEIKREKNKIIVIGENSSLVISKKWKYSYVINCDIDETPSTSRYNLNIFCHQYLQSKGYDLPQHLLGGKNLKESGLAIYK